MARRSVTISPHRLACGESILLLTGREKYVAFGLCLRSKARYCTAPTDFDARSAAIRYLATGKFSAA